MRSIWIEQAISNLGGIIVIILQLGFIAVLTALIILIVTEIIKAAVKGNKEQKGAKKNVYGHIDGMDDKGCTDTIYRMRRAYGYIALYTCG